MRSLGNAPFNAACAFQCGMRRSMRRSALLLPLMFSLIGAGSELSVVLPSLHVWRARAEVERWHGVGRHGECSFRGLMVGRRVAHVLRIRGGFKAKWGEKYMPGLGKKRKGLSATQKRHHEEDKFIHLLEHKQWANKEQEMHRLIASGDLADRSKITRRGHGEHTEEEPASAVVKDGAGDLPSRGNKTQRTLSSDSGASKKARLEQTNATEPAGDMQGAPPQRMRDGVVEGGGEKSRTRQEEAANSQATPGGSDVEAPRLDLKTIAERALQGDATAQVMLGESFLNGEQSYDAAMALSCFQQALSQGPLCEETCVQDQGERMAAREGLEAGGGVSWSDDWVARSHYGIGVCLRDGCGSQEEAIDAFEQAAAVGHVMACLELGLVYLGRALPTDRRAAMMPYVLNHSAARRGRKRVPIPEAHGSRGAQATVDEEEEEEGCVDGVQQRTAGVEARPQNFEMAAQALKRGAEVQVTAGMTASADYARYCQWICKFEFGVMLLRQQVPRELAGEELPRLPPDHRCESLEQSQSVGGKLAQRQRAVALIESAAGAGIAEAQFALALIMNPPDVDPPGSCPDGTTKALRAISRERCADAIRWLRRAALQGHRQAANCLGLHYLLAGVKGKKGAALRWLRIAARSGLAEGMMNLAKAHAEAAADSDGGGGEASAGIGGGALAEQQAEQLQYSLALKWCRRAARADCPEAFLALGRFHKKGVPEVLAADGAKAMSYFRAAARRGCAEAAMELGSCYYAGEGVEADFQKAFEWFQHGAKAGDACCMFRLADLYEAGIGVKKSKHTALGWYNKGSFAMQMCKGGPSPGPPAEGLSEMSTWEGLESMAKRSGGDGGRGDEQDANEQGEDEDDEARAEREKFEAWCKISTPRQIALFHKIQADLDAAA